MAWTTSAGPGGGFALATADGERIFSRRFAVLDRLSVASRPRQLALATAAHLASLAVVAPLVGHNPVIAIPIIFGLAVSCVILARPHNVKDAAHGFAALADDDQRCAPGALPPERSGASRLASCAPGNKPTVTHASVSPAEVSAELRADLMARVSHELRTPLNAVMGFSDLMGHQLFGPLGHPRYEEYVTHIRESSQRLLKSAEDTLAMTSLMARSPSQCDREALGLDGVVKGALSAVATDAGRRGISTLLMLADEVEVVANRRALRQALVNILTEAIDRASDGAEIMLSTHIHGDKLTLTVSIDRSIVQFDEAHASLPMCLARTLLELDGCRLFEHAPIGGDWSAIVTLDCATQRDFFTPSLTN